MKSLIFVNPVIFLSLLFASLTSQADSFIRVINNSSYNLQGIWQAGGCAEVEFDWHDEIQYTVCKKTIIAPGNEQKYEFGPFHSDRSVKVFALGAGRIAYCNSMDYASVTVSDGDAGKFDIEYTCP